jgi:hypothetical protein
MDDPRIEQYERERDEAIEIAHKAMVSSYIGPPPKLRGDAERMVAALLKAGWTPPNDDARTVYVLSRWASCADHVDYGPVIFATHEGARRRADEINHVGVRGWWKQRDDRWIKWKKPKLHAAGFWEILAKKIEA